MIKTKQFALRKSGVRIPSKEVTEIKPGCTQSTVFNESLYSEEESTFGTLEEALKELKKHKTYINYSDAKYYVEEYFVDSVTIIKEDEDDEYPDEEDYDIIEFSEMSIEFTDEHYNTIGIARSMKEAIDMEYELLQKYDDVRCSVDI